MTLARGTHRRSLLSAGALLGALFLGTPPAAAHNVVEERIPAPNSTVTESPVAISLATDDLFLDLGGEAKGFGVVLRDSAGLYYGDGCVEVLERKMTASAELGQADTYQVIYQFVSADGHPLSESYEFVFEPGPDHTAAPGYDTPAECGVPRNTPEEESGPVATPTPTSLEDTSQVEEAPRDPLLIAGFLSLVTIAVVVWLVWRFRQKHGSI
jgi:copper resistance protein C